MYKVFDHLVTGLQLLAANEFIWLVRLVNTARATDQAIDTNRVEQAGLGTKAHILADLVDWIDGTCVGYNRSSRVSMQAGIIRRFFEADRALGISSLHVSQ